MRPPLGPEGSPRSRQGPRPKARDWIRTRQGRRVPAAGGVSSRFETRKGHSMRNSTLLAAAAVWVLAAGAAQAETLKVSADLKGASEGPANTTAGNGSVTATV